VATRTAARVVPSLVSVTGRRGIGSREDAFGSPQSENPSERWARPAIPAEASKASFTPARGLPAHIQQKSTNPTLTSFYLLLVTPPKILLL
jgi:hypothetical protein